MIGIQELQTLFSLYKEQNINGRYIHNKNILPIINLLKRKVEIDEIGRSVLNEPIFKIIIGNGLNKILIWSQMHGNESTTTKALFDLINTLLNGKDFGINAILSQCTLLIIPILNPDGAKAYSRFNANNVDLNRDAQNLSQPESLILKKAFEEFRPNYCFNLHGQRTIFSAGNKKNPATISFLAPAQDNACSLTDTRKIAMELIAVMNKALQQVIPNQVGVYDDSFNINCVGDTFQSMNIPTILFEAGHFKDDYEREKTREYIYQSLLTALDYISTSEINGDNYKDYFLIPENQKLFFDVILRNAYYKGKIVDIAIQFDEVLKKDKILFKPVLKQVGDLKSFFGHKEIKLNKKEIDILNNDPEKEIEIVIVDKYSEIKPLIIKEF